MTGTQYASARKTLGLSQAELASELSVNRITIGRIEAMAEVPALYEKALQYLLDKASANAR